MSRIISIIGCGWLGKPLAISLLSKGFIVKGSTTTSEKLSELRSLGIEPHHIVLGPDFRSDKHHSFFDAEIVLVNVPPRRKSNEPSAYYLQMQMLAEAIVSSRPSKVIMISATSVYPQKEGHYSEEEADQEHDLARVEKLFQGNDQVESTIVRFAGLVGRGRHPGRFLAGKNVVTEGDGVVNLIHLDDCIGVIETIIRKDAWGEVFNACAAQHPSRRLFYSTVMKDLEVKLPEFQSGGKIRTIDSDKLRTRLDYLFRFDDPLTMTY